MKFSFALFLLSITSIAAGCFDFVDDGTWTQLPLNDDSSTYVDLPFAFDFYGSRTSMYINTNGNLSFEGPYEAFSPVDFPSNEYQMIAPFWADVDTTVSGDIWYKAIGSEKFVVTWTEVAHYNYDDDNSSGLVNDFQVIISTGNDSDMGLGNNVCFCYGDMQWTTGADSDGIDGFGGSPATVGVNAGTFAPENTYFLIGQFDKPGDSYDGPNGLPDGIDYLDHKSYCFNLESATQKTSPPTVAPVPPPSGSNGDPHFKTWTGEHYEYHGQCDLVLTKDPTFADGLGLDVQIRTKLVRYWSYIKSVAIRLGDDILEVQGSGEPTPETNYWVNFEYRGELKSIGGFPVKAWLSNNIKHNIEIDVGSKYPGLKICITTFRDFIKVDFVGASEQSMGNAIGMLGDFKSGATLARDGFSILDDFSELGQEWQVLPTELMLFHNVENPQFPKSCIEPEDPRGERRRRLSESSITQEQAEAACASLKDPLDRKDCVYDIIVTQDLDMVGAF
jgi:hypothetical protein